MSKLAHLFLTEKDQCLDLLKKKTVFPIGTIVVAQLIDSAFC